MIIKIPITSTLSKYAFLIFVLLFLSSITLAGTINTEFPNTIKSNEKYVFYAHGFIVEGDNPTPVHPRWGKYDFPTVKQALSDSGYHLIAYHRAKGTVPKQAAKRVANDIAKLNQAGVPYSNIAIVGFSRGGAIAALTSGYVNQTDLKIIILAGCTKYINNHPSVEVIGKVYSIYETSDQVGSCQQLIDRSAQVASFKELAITTGKEHGAFYLPRREWLKPVKQWLISD